MVGIYHNKFSNGFMKLYIPESVLQWLHVTTCNNLKVMTYYNQNESSEIVGTYQNKFSNG